MHILKIILDICLLRGRAQDLPASMNLVWLTAAASVAVNALGMPERATDLAQLLFIASQAVMFGAVIWLLLRLRGFRRAGRRRSRPCMPWMPCSACCCCRFCRR